MGNGTMLSDLLSYDNSTSQCTKNYQPANETSTPCTAMDMIKDVDRLNPKFVISKIDDHKKVFLDTLFNKPK
jgi:hypothetical protein